MKKRWKKTYPASTKYQFTERLGAYDRAVVCWPDEIGLDIRSAARPRRA